MGGYNPREEVQKINKCVRTRLPGFCTAGKDADPAFDALSQVTDTSAYVGNTNDTETQGPLVRKARAVFTDFRKFQVCFAKCVKESAISCHQKKGCAVNFPSVDEFSAAVKDCRPKEWRNYFNVRRACQCIAFRQHAKALVGKCILLGNQFFMRNL
ncbi:hypothetical protein AAVH_06596 [Aphelenchoides avenae]|nr:hypothetical protein AAVH_06596 [Aphelenchus avenae]